jgi:hypothetical protein
MIACSVSSNLSIDAQATPSFFAHHPPCFEVGDGPLDGGPDLASREGRSLPPA